MALTADQLAYWESSPQDIPLYLYIHSPAIAFAARVNQTSFTNPIMQVTFDTVTVGDYTDVREGMTILFGSAAGLDDLGRVPARLDASGLIATSTVLYFQRASQGVGDGEVNLVDNAYITVLDQYLIWMIPPYITDAGVVYKNGNIPWHPTLVQRPTANAGADVLKVVAQGVTDADVYFDASTSAPYNPAATGSLTYAWEFEDGTPSTSSSATPGLVNFPVGKRHVHLTVFDSAASPRQSHRLIVVAEDDDPDLIKYWDVESWTERVDGQDLRVRVHQPLSYEDYPDGTDVLICTSENPDQVGLAGREHMLFSGWLHDEVNRVEATAQGLTSRLSFQLLDAAGRLKLLHQFPESIDRESSPDSWATMAGANLDRLAHYSLDWHSTALTRVDYIGANELDVYAVRGLEIGGDNLFEGVNFIAGAMAYVLTCDVNNRLVLKQDPQLAPTSAQNTALGIGIVRTTSETLTLQPKHWQSYEYTHKRMPRVHFNWGEALLSSTANMSSTTTIPTAFVVAPGLAPGQGTSESNTTRQVARNVNELRMRVGNVYRARQNAVTENFQFLVNPMRPAIHPANMEWLRVTLDSSVSGYRGRTLSNVRILPIEISYRTDISKRIRRATISVEVEVTDATAATQYTPASNGSNNWSVNIPDISLGDWVYEPIPPEPIPEWSGALPISGWLLSSKAARAHRADSFDPVGGTVSFTDISTGLSGSGIDGFSDPFDFRRTYALTSDGIYVEPDRSNPSTFTQLKATASLFASGTGHKARASHMVSGWRGIVAGKNAFLRTLNDFGSVTTSSINGLTLDYSGGDQSADFCIMGHNAGHILALAPYHANTARAAVYKSSDNGATWALYADIAATTSQNPYYGDVDRQWIEVPYNRLDGSPNIDDANLEFWWYAVGDVNTGQVGRLTVFDSAGTNVVSGAGFAFGDNGATMTHPMTAFTHQSSYAYANFRNAINATADGWTSASGSLTSMGGVGDTTNVNGISTNPLPMVAWTSANIPGAHVFLMTLDGTNFFGSRPAEYDAAEGAAVVEFSLYDVQ